MSQTDTTEVDVQELEQEGFELLVGAVELVDQQHRGAACVRLQRLQQRPRDQEPLGKELARARLVDAEFLVVAQLRVVQPDGLPAALPVVRNDGVVGDDVDVAALVLA